MWLSLSDGVQLGVTSGDAARSTQPGPRCSRLTEALGGTTPPLPGTQRRKHF